MSELDDTKPLSVGEWFVTRLILAIPIVGIVMYFVWAFGVGNVNRRNFCRASLLWLAIIFGLAIIVAIVAGVFAVFVAHAAQYS